LLSLAETFGLLLIGMRWTLDPQLQAVIALDPGQLQTVMFLQLAVGGHLLLFSVRTKHALFAPPYPSGRLFRAIAATQVVAVLLCIFGVGVEAIPGSAVVGVWLYCLVWLAVMDLIKLAYWRWGNRRDGEALAQHVHLATQV
jgi:H+-transporting ATPase